MRNPDPPFLELGFYFRDLSGREAIRLLAMSFVSSFDAFPKDAVTIDSSSRSLFRANESSDRVEQLGNTEQMGRLLSDPSKFVKKITIEDGSGIVPDAREYLAVLPIASPECESEGNSVSVWVEGEAFCRASTHNGLENEQRTAAKALEVFKNCGFSCFG